MLFSTRFHEPIRTGAVTLTFRRWKRPQARVGGQYRLHSHGVIEVDRVGTVERHEITDEDARRAGFETARALIRDLDRYEGDLYRIAFHYIGDIPDPRAELAFDDALTEDDRAEIATRLAKMDGGTRGPWTHAVLRLIEGNEGVRAADLAVHTGQETLRFKGDVRRLKAMGLTESLEVGYRLSPRGRAVLARLPGEGASVTPSAEAPA